MVIALDSYYKDDICNTSLVLFANEKSSVPIYTDTIYTKVESEYIPGQFYKRELPGIEKILDKFIEEHEDWWQEIDFIMVDSFVYLATEWEEGEEHEDYVKIKEWAGLGRHVGQYTLTHKVKNKYIIGKSFDKVIPVIGVAKSNFGICDKQEITGWVYRGKSKNPLYVQTCWGLGPRWDFLSEDDFTLEYAIEFVKNMHGENRIPTMLKEVDRLSRIF